MAIDAATLRELKALDAASGGGLLDELLGMFARGTPERIARCRAAVAVSDARALEGEAHALKGSAGAVGAFALLALAGELEARAKAGQLADASAKLDALEREFRAALDELTREKALT